MRYLAKILVLNAFFLLITCVARSPHRTIDPETPTIEAQWSHKKERGIYQLTESHLSDAIFHYYNQAYFNEHLLPTGEIPYRYTPNQSVLGKLLSALINDLIAEIQSTPKLHKHHKFSHFTTLKMRDVDSHDKTGLYVLKFDDYPFIIKLFIDTPEAFVRPMAKGLEPMFFYYMGGGIGRHLAGFSRIKNLEDIQHLINNCPEWQGKIGFPRKWFWLPENAHWISVTGQNIGPQKQVAMKIPAIYAVICDEIIWERPFKLSNANDRDIVLRISNFLEQRLDLHINNFGIEQKTGLITPIDFEFFPANCGLAENQRTCSGYLDWYSRLSYKFLKDTMLRNKKERRALQYAAQPSMNLYA